MPQTMTTTGRRVSPEQAQALRVLLEAAADSSLADVAVYATAIRQRNQGRVSPHATLLRELTVAAADLDIACLRGLVVGVRLLCSVKAFTVRASRGGTGARR